MGSGITADGSELLVMLEGHPDSAAGLFGKDGSLLWSQTEPNSSKNSGKISDNGEYSVIGMRNNVILLNRQGNIIWTKKFESNSSDVQEYYNDKYYLVDISRDGALIAAAANGFGPRGNALTVITTSGEIIWTANLIYRTDLLAMSADGEYIATGSGSTLNLFKKDRNLDIPSYTSDFKSNIKYDTKSYVGDYLVPKYFTTGNLVLGAIIIGFLIGIGYGIWRIKKHLSEKNP
jgi:hypothetical protein